MLEKFMPGRKAEQSVQEVIQPLEKAAGQTFSLPEVTGTSPINDHKDDWLLTDEYADEQGNRMLSLARYKEDGGIEARHGIPADKFDAYQVDVDAQRRVLEARADTVTHEGTLARMGNVAVRRSIVDMVRAVRHDQFNEKYAGLESFEKRQSDAIREQSDTRISESLHTIEDYRRVRRRKNPLQDLQRGKHHAGRA